jgi:hypothetical protein
MGDHDALDVLDDPDPADRAAAHVVLAVEADERHQLQEGGVAIEQELDALADEQLAAVPMALHVLGPASGKRQREQLVDLGEPLEHRLAVGAKRLRSPVERGRKGRHYRNLAVRGANSPVASRQR